MKKELSNLNMFFLFAANVAAWGCTNIYIPCLPNVAADFGINDFLAKLTILLGFPGGIIGRFFTGPLSDFFGRKKMLLSSISISAIGLLGCYLSYNIYWFLFFRFFQGIGSAAVFVQVISIISDTQTGDKRAKALSIVELSWPIAWGLAPILGAYIDKAFHWRMNFLLLIISLTVIGVYLFINLPETLKTAKSKAVSENKFHFENILKGYISFSRHKIFLSYALIPGIVLSGYMLFAINGPFLYKSSFGYTPEKFAAIQSFPLIAYFLTIFLYRYIIMNFGFKSAYKVGFRFYSFYAIITLIFLFNIIPSNPNTIISIICLQCLANAFLVPSGSACALQYAQNSLGTAASFISIARHSIVSFCMCISGLFEVTIASVFTMIFATTIFVFFLTSMRKKVMKKSTLSKTDSSSENPDDNSNFNENVDENADRNTKENERAVKNDNNKDPILNEREIAKNSDQADDENIKILRSDQSNLIKIPIEKNLSNENAHRNDDMQQLNQN